MKKIRAVVHRQPEVMSSFEIYLPKNINYNQDGNRNDNKVWITNFFLKCQKMTAKIFWPAWYYGGQKISAVIFPSFQKNRCSPFLIVIMIDVFTCHF
jgi:hypothetical protein